MKFIKPSVNYCPQLEGIDGVWTQIAIATRVCYQSKPKENESDKDFVKRVIFAKAIDGYDEFGAPIYDFRKMHGSVLEHGTIYLTVPIEKSHTDDIVDLLQNEHTRWIDTEDYCYITTNMRVIVENYLDYLINDYLSIKTPNHPNRTTFSIVSNIGVTREFNRHRVNSPSEESTRWCTYSAGRFGGEIGYAYQPWIGNDYKTMVEDMSKLTKEQQFIAFKDWCRMIANDEIEDWTKESYLNFGLKAAEFSYLGMKEHHATNDEARTVLNLGTKTQEIVTAFDTDWEHFLELRYDEISGHVHPDMKIVADMINEWFETFKNRNN